VPKGKKLAATIFCNSCPYPIYDGGLRFFEQTRRIKTWPNFKNMEKIVDIGCGATPFPFANILVDNDLKLGTDRHGLKIPKDGRAIIEADLEWGLPFKEKEVDFAYCSHLLEHCQNPNIACDELIRVSKSGFIEVPNIVFELVLGGNDLSHKWVCEYSDEEKILRFRKLRTSERHAIEQRVKLGNKLVDLLLDKQKRHRYHMDAYWKNQDIFSVCFLWYGKFDYEVL